MDWMNILEQVFNVVLIPLLGVATTALIVFISAKTKELKEKHNDELFSKYADMLEQTIISCVIATNQTYVEALKKEGKFDAEAQKVAFDKTFSAVITILSDDAYDYLSEAIGDLEEYITNRIEAAVNTCK
jgi:hypothetical protein